MDLEKLLKFEAFGTFESTIGTLCCFASSMKDQSALEKALPEKLEDTSPEDFARAFARFVCFPADSLKEGKFKPDEPVLRQEDVEKFSEDDLESFAKMYVENSPYLYRRQEQKRKKDSEGNLGVTPYHGEILHPQVEGESYVDYLHRLTTIERAERREQLNKLTRPFSSFSGGVAERIRRNLSHGDALNRALGQLKPEIHDPGFSIETKLPDYNWGKIQRDVEAARRAPFDELAERLDQLIDSSIESSRFMVESNQIQAQVAEEIKNSGDSASRHSRRNLWLSGLIILLTVLGLGVTSYSIHQGSKESESARAFSRDALKDLKSSLQNLTDSIGQGDAKSKAVLDEQLRVLRELAQDREDEALRQKRIDGQLDALGVENRNLRVELDSLRKKVEDVRKSKD